MVMTTPMQDPSNETYRKALEMCEKVRPGHLAMEFRAGVLFRSAHIMAYMRCFVVHAPACARTHITTPRPTPPHPTATPGIVPKWPLLCCRRTHATAIKSLMGSHPCGRQEHWGCHVHSFTLACRGVAGVVCRGGCNHPALPPPGAASGPQAPEYYDEIQSHIQASGGGGGASEAGPARKASPISEVWFDVGGWVLLGAAVVAALMLARASAPKAA